MMALAAGISPEVRRTRLWWLQRAKLAMARAPGARPCARSSRKGLGLSLGRFVAPIERPDAVQDAR